LSGTADERLALHVFVGAGCFADKHQIRVGMAHAEHDLAAAERVELAARAVADVVANVLQGREELHGRGRRVNGFHRFGSGQNP
jgi:hypothetical protein